MQLLMRYHSLPDECLVDFHEQFFTTHALYDTDDIDINELGCVAAAYHSFLVPVRLSIE